MPKQSLVIIALLCASIASTASSTEAGQTKPVQVALWSPAQIFPPTTAIEGVRLSILNGVNTSVTGLDLGIANRTTGNCLGLQYGQVGLVNVIRSKSSLPILPIVNWKF